MTNFLIRDVALSDADALCDVFNYYVHNSPNTFETIPMTSEKMEEKILNLVNKGYPFIVLEVNGKVCGYTYLSQFRHFTAYDCTAELAVFLAQSATQKGYGKRMIQALLNHTKSARFHSIISAITVSNEPSCKLHERLGFVAVGEMPEIGFKHEKYHAVRFYQSIRK